LIDASGTTVASNDNWQDNNSTDLAEISRTNLEPANAAESAIVATLAAGGYTAIVSGAGGTTGVALVEAYHISTP